MIVRPWLQTLPRLAPVFAAEATLAEKLQARFTGWKTKIAARLITIAGIMVGLYDQSLPYITGQDWTPLTSKLPAWALPRHGGGRYSVRLPAQGDSQPATGARRAQRSRAQGNVLLSEIFDHLKFPVRNGASQCCWSKANAGA
jgi:hypothetical protein